MSTAARFLLEFEARGDQEVVSKIKAIGQAGKELESDFSGVDSATSNLENTFDGLASGAEGARAPMQELGTATNEMIGEVTAADPELQALVTSFEDAGSAAEESTGKTESFGSSITGMTGAITAIGGTIGTLVSTMFRYRDAQIAVQTAQQRLQSATEAYRKSQVAIDTVLSKATSNTDAIAAARARLSEAMAKLNKMQNDGITSGRAYEAAVAEVTAAQQALRTAAAGTGVDMNKLEASMKTNQISSLKQATAVDKNAKALQNQQAVILESIFGFTSMAGSIVQTVTGMDKMRPALKGMSAGFKDLISWIGRGGLSLTGTLIPALGTVVLGLAAVIEGFQLFRAIPRFIEGIMAAVEGNVDAAAQKFLELMEILKAAAKFAPFGALQEKALDPLINKLKELIKQKGVDIDETKLQEAASLDYKTALGDITNQYQPYIDALLGVTAEQKNSALAANDMSNAVGMSGEAVGTAGVQLQKTEADLFKLTETTNNAVVAFGGVVNRIDEFNLRAGKQSQTVQEAKGTLDGYLNTLSIVGPSLVGINKEVDNAALAFNNLTTSFGTTKKGAADSALAFNELSNHAHAGGEAIRVYSTEADNAVDPTASADDEVRILGEDLDESGSKAQEAAHELLTLAGSAKNAQEAIDQTHLGFAQSVDALADMNTVMANSTARYEAMQTIVNATATAVKEEAIQLEAEAAIASNAAIQRDKVTNAFLEGAIEIANWRNELEQAEANEHGQIAALEAMGLTFDKLPDFMEPTIENLKLLGAAATGSAEAMVAFDDAVRESFGKATAFADSQIESLMDLFDKGEANEKFDEWLEGLPEEVRKDLTAAEAVELKHIAKFRNNLQSLSESFSLNVTLHGMDAARQEYAQGLRDMGDDSDGIWDDITESAADIVEEGSVEAIERMNDALSSGLDPQTILKQLENIKTAEAGKKAGEQFITSIKSAMSAGASGIGPLAQSLMSNVVPKGERSLKAQAVPKVDADTTQAAQKLAAIATSLNTLNAFTATPKVDADVTGAVSKLMPIGEALGVLNTTTAIPKVDADVKAAASKLNTIGKALGILNGYRAIPKVDADVKTAATKLNTIGKALGVLNRYTAKPKVTVNNSQALNAIRQVQSKLSGLKNISRTITYRYKTVGSPPRGAQSGMHETLASDTLIAAHKGERVDISPKGAGGTGPEHQNIVHNIYSGSNGKETTVSVPVFLDGKLLTRIVRRHLAEDVTAGM